jgi:integrase/recombinase XerC
MRLQVERDGEGARLVGDGDDVVLANRFLEHLSIRNFATATRRAYAYDVLNFLRFCAERALPLAAVSAMDLFDYLDWQVAPYPGTRGRVVVPLREGRGAAPATMNRRVAAVRGLFEYAVLAGARRDNPVPAARRSTGVRAVRRGMLGHLGPGRLRGGGRLVRAARRLPESLDPREVAAFIADLATARDRAMALAMLLGGLRASEVRGLRLSHVDMGLRRLRVVGKGGRGEWFRWTGRSSPSWPPTCGRSDRRAAPPRRPLWCCVARPWAGRSPRLDCGGSSGPTGPGPARCGCGRIGCGTPTAPNSPRPG